MADISITFADNDMKAYLMLPEPEDDTFDYYSEEVLTEIKKKGISQGLDKETVMDMVKGHVYNTPVLIAEGTPVIDGIDGYFEYMFSQEDSHKKPQILDNGTVDYSNVNSVGTVSKNDLIATYHEAVPGHFGYTVKGTLLKPRGAKDFQVPRLVGCRYDKNTNNFYSDEDGKVEVEPGKITVKSTLEINKNVNQTYGNVSFIGDIEINGNVESGVEIRASGNITITGIVQSAMIEAGDSVTIEGGISGGEHAIITCGKNLKAKFIEYAEITAHGDIEAGYILDCDVHCGGKIVTDEEKGSIVGGSLYAAEEIKTRSLGNRQGIKTRVSVGKVGDEDDEYKKYGIVLDESRRRLDLINVREVTLYKTKEMIPDFDYQVQTIKKEKLKEILKRRYAEKMRRVIERLLDSERKPCRVNAKYAYAGVTAYLDCVKYAVKDEEFELRLRSDVLIEEEKARFEGRETIEEVKEEVIRKKIMIIDDDPVSLALTQGLLHKEYDVMTVQSGVEAIPMIMDNHPDIIFLDYEMPDLDGKMTLKMIRAGESMKDIPVFFLTGAGDKEHIQSVLALKPNGYLLKPAKKEHLINAIKKVFP